MTKPSPAVLRSCAEHLRTLATSQEQNAQHCDDLLAGVLKLADVTTWSGPYPSATNREFGSWQSGLARSAVQLRAEATRWRVAAKHFDAEADAGATTGAPA